MRGDVTSFDLGPAGLHADHGLLLWGVGMIAFLILPLGLVALILALTARDFPLGLRIFLGVIGALGSLGSLAPAAWLFGSAWLGRTRIQVSPAGVIVRRRVGPWRRVRTVIGLDTLTTAPTVCNAASPLREPRPHGPRILLASPTWRIPLGAGLAPDEVTALGAALAAALRDARARPVTGAGPPVEWAYPMVPGAGSTLASAVGVVLAPLRQPLPFLFLDLAVLAGSLALAPVIDELDYRDIELALTVAFAFYLGGLLLRLHDPSYLAGLRWHAQRSWSFPRWFVTAGLLCGLVPGFAATGPFGEVLGVYYPLLFIVPIAHLALAATLHVTLLRRSRERAATPPRRRVGLELVAMLLLGPLALLAEVLAFSFFDGMAKELGPLALPMVPLVIALLYWPVRMHAFIDDPGDRSNVVWFWLTVGALTLFAVTGIGP